MSVTNVIVCNLDIASAPPCISADSRHAQECYNLSSRLKLAVLAGYHLFRVEPTSNPFFHLFLEKKFSTYIFGNGIWSTQDSTISCVATIIIMREHELARLRNSRRQASSWPYFSCYLFNCQVRRFCFKKVTVQNSVRLVYLTPRTVI